MDLRSTSVALLQCPAYREPQLSETITRLCDAVMPGRNYRSLRIVLKPNLITAKSVLACTEKAFLLAAARWFIDRGAVVAVGDSPAFGNSFSVLGQLDVAEPLQRLNVSIVNFSTIRKVRLSGGVVAGLAGEALDADLLVNLPRIKAHGQLTVTMAVKNCFGCLVGMRKPFWHMRYGGCHGNFAPLLVELLSCLPATLSLVDGIVAMHETGPIRGREYPLGLAAAGLNPVAVDTALLHLLGVEPATSPLWSACQHKGLTGTSLETLTFPLQDPRSLRVTDFVVPARLAPIRFSPFRFLHGALRRLFLHLHFSA